MCNRYQTPPQNLVQRGGVGGGYCWWWWWLGGGMQRAELILQRGFSGRPPRDRHDELAENRAKALEMQSEPGEHRCAAEKFQHRQRVSYWVTFIYLFIFIPHLLSFYSHIGTFRIFFYFFNFFYLE